MPGPTRLQNAPAAPDRAVFAAYGRPPVAVSRAFGASSSGMRCAMTVMIHDDDVVAAADPLTSLRPRRSSLNRAALPRVGPFQRDAHAVVDHQVGERFPVHQHDLALQPTRVPDGLLREAGGGGDEDALPGVLFAQRPRNLWISGRPTVSFQRFAWM